MSYLPPLLYLVLEYHGSDIASLGGTVHETETVLLAADKIQTVHGTMILVAPLFFFRIHTRLT